MIWQLLALCLTLIPVAMVVLAVYMWRWLRNDSRRDPLTSELLALPGARLQQQLNTLDEDLMTAYMGGLLICGSLGSLILSRHVSGDLSALTRFDLMLIAVSVAVGLWTSVKLVKVARARRLHHQGLRAEMATAQEISTVLYGNLRLLNDLDCGEFNIDHVVISPAGVFAIETKSRRKLAEGSGSPKVFYDGKCLKFPNWTETKPLAQAARQAQWLSNHLRLSTGQPFPVLPVLALPGWFVETTVRLGEGEVRVVNPKNSARLFLPNSAPLLSDAQIQQIAFALTKLAKAPED